MTLEEQKQVAASNLRDAKDALDSLDIPFCLFLGTALGAYRDKDFCPGDVDDVDIAVSVQYINQFRKIESAMQDKGFDGGLRFINPEGIAPEAAFEKYYFNDQVMSYYERSTNWWKSKVDIFFITPVEDKMAWVFYTDLAKNEYQVRLVNDYFQKFDKVEFYGTEYNVPGPIEEYLAENYGENWKTPIHRDNWTWDKDNKVPIR